MKIILHPTPHPQLFSLPVACELFLTCLIVFQERERKRERREEKRETFSVHGDPPRRQCLPNRAGGAEPAAEGGGDPRLDAASSLSTAERERERKRERKKEREGGERVREMHRKNLWQQQQKNQVKIRIGTEKDTVQG